MAKRFSHSVLRWIEDRPNQSSRNMYGVARMHCFKAQLRTRIAQRRSTGGGHKMISRSLPMRRFAPRAIAAARELDAVAAQDATDAFAGDKTDESRDGQLSKRV